jgi:Ribbon-helix-helix protein, copG family
MPKPERQTARVALLTRPSMKRRVERRARTAGVTANEFIRRAIEQALGPTAKALANNP